MYAILMLLLRSKHFEREQIDRAAFFLHPRRLELSTYVLTLDCFLLGAIAASLLVECRGLIVK